MSFVAAKMASRSYDNDKMYYSIYRTAVIEIGSTSVERRQWSAVSGAPSIERELIECCVGRAPSVER